MARGFSRSGRSSSGGGGRIGGSSGGSRSYSGGGSSGSYRPRGPMRIPMFGRVVVIGGGALSLLSFMLMFFIISCIMLFSSFSMAGESKEEIAEWKSLVQKYEDYDVRFKDIIAKAQSSDPQYSNYQITDAYCGNRVISYYDDDPTTPGIYKAFIVDNAMYYFVVYEYTAVDGSQKTDSTFAQYLYQDVPTGTIKIAHAKINGEYWAINTDYSLEKNMDYKDALMMLKEEENDLKGTKTLRIVSIVVLCVTVAVIAVIMVKNFKKAKRKEEVEKAQEQASIAEAKAREEQAESQARSVNRKCAYCGNPIPDGDRICPACGSRQFEKDN